MVINIKNQTSSSDTASEMKMFGFFILRVVKNQALKRDFLQIFHRREQQYITNSSCIRQ